MKTTDFQTYLEKRLDKEEIDDIEKQAALEIKSFESTNKISKDPNEVFKK